MSEYVIEVSHSWTAVFEADSQEEAREQALAMDEEMPVDAMGTEVEVVWSR
jgi:hypothetical protein